MKKMITFVVIFAGAYAGMLLLLFLLQRSLLYYPSKSAFDAVELNALGFELVEYAAPGGLRLQSLYRKSPKDGRTILYFHGNAGHAGHRAQKVRPYLDAGYSVFLAGYRGYGPNPGKVTEKGLYEDAEAALNYLKEKGITEEQIILYGESLGTGVAVNLAQSGNFSALVLESSFSSIANVAQSQFPIFPVKSLVRDRFESESKIAAVDAPILFLHGLRDRTVPVRFGRALFAAARGPKEFFEFPDAGHNDLYDYGAADRLIGYLKSQGLEP
jgi:fermentation-respiration switch protein FrsA (DUF1100 family)